LSDIAPIQPPPWPPLRRLPLLTLYATDRCNSRCVTCDYWKHGKTDITVESVARLLPDLKLLRTEVVLLSGGEPLVNPEWATITRLLRLNGLKVWLLTSGLSLAKFAPRVADLFQAITVSMDGTDRGTYAAIRGLDAFDRVCQGVRAIADHGLPASIRVTLQRANFRQLPDFVDLAKAIGARQVSFLAVDVANSEAFGRISPFSDTMTLGEEDVPALLAIIDRMERDYAEDFRSGYIAENPQKLRRIAQYFSAVQGKSSYPPVRCNAPEFSAVMNAAGHLQPCFFIAAPDTQAPGQGVMAALNEDSMTELRAQIRAGNKRQCATCVCSLWRDLDRVGEPHSLLPPAQPRV
jgi:Fe-coproporphyrin III synthase